MFRDPATSLAEREVFAMLVDEINAALRGSSH
jgi:hypothetical protein